MRKKKSTELIKCPYCKQKLRESGIGYSQAGVMLYKLISDGENLDYEIDEFTDTDGGEFYCRNCGRTLPLTEDEVIKILK